MRSARPTTVASVTAAIALAASAVLALAVARAPRSAWLAAPPAGSWILYPHTPRAGIRPAVALDTHFRRSFELDVVPASASMRVRAFRRAEVRVNDVVVLETGDGAPAWREGSTVDVGPYLRAGENVVSVTVWNDRGPPSLALDVSWPGGHLESDGTWDSSLAGAAWRSARHAGARVDASGIDPALDDIRPWASVRERWLALALMTLVGAAIVVAAETLWRRAGARWLERAALAIVLLSWAALFINNAPSLSVLDGYDAEGHLAYAQHLLDHGSVPRADQGWSMFQPPLYYGLTAAGLKLAGVSAFDPSASWVIRIEGLLFGAVQLVMIFGCLRLLFPGRVRASVVGLLLAAYLPVQLYTFQYVGNDALASTLGIAALYVALRILRAGRPTWAAHVVLGALVGAALLSKLSMIVVAGVVVATLAFATVVGNQARRERIVGLALTCAVALAVCAWHFWRVAARFGSPFVGNWDPRVLAAWWQDPGYVTTGYLARFGEVLARPLLGALGSLPDGLYSTLWGDGLLGGQVRLALAPPWDWSAMASGYALALIPAALIAAGAAIAVARWVRAPTATDSVAIALFAATALALVLWPIRLPIYSVIKASFGLPAALSLAVFAALAVAAVARASPWAARIVLVALVVWALNAYVSLWIPRDAARAQARLGWLEVVVGEAERAERHIAAALGSDPHEPLARLARARLLERAGLMDEAVAEVGAVLARHPDHARAHLEMALLLEASGEAANAEAHYREVTELRRGEAAAHLGLARQLRARGDLPGAIAQFREALATVPERPEVHRDLALSLAASGDERGAERHLALAERLTF